MTRDAESSTEPYVARLERLAGDGDPVAILADTPHRLERLIAEVPPERLAHQPAPGKWSVAEILAHLADSELVFAHRLRMVLAASPLPLTPFEPDDWANSFDYGNCDARESLALFAAVREANVRLVRRVPAAYLARIGTHEEWGAETAAALLRIEAGHDRNHLAQIEHALGTAASGEAESR